MANHDSPALITTPRLPVQSVGNLETKNLLDCPFEIQAMVYTDFFAAEFYESSEVSLLLANKAVWEEAVPFFHRLHEFQLRILDDRKTILTVPLPYYIQQVLRAVAKVRLGNQGAEFDAAVDHVGIYIIFVKREFTELKSLKTPLGLESCNGHDHLGAVNGLQQLWPRLDYLQLTVEYQRWEYAEEILPRITPGLK